MINIARVFFILGTFFVSGSLTGSPFSVAHSFSRRKQFLEHRREGEEFNLERVKGLKQYIEEEERWELQRLLAFEKREKTKHSEVEMRRAEDYHKYVIKRSEQLEEYEKHLADHLRQRKAETPGVASDLSESEELDLLSQRPRFDVKKRVLYGAKPKSKKGESAKKTSDGYGSGRFGGMPDSSSPGSGYSPPSPPMHEPDFNDFPPPPPLPPMPSYDDGDFPPPPPPPPFDDGGDGF